jgi:peptidoglycan LD-endopeptidase LytH
MFVALAALPLCGVAAVPPVEAQEDPADEAETASDRAVVQLDVDVANSDVTTIAGALGTIGTNVADQVAALETAQGNLDAAVAALAEADAAVSETQFRIEDLTVQSDAVVTASFVNPPAEDVLETLNEEVAADASIKQAVLDIQADADAGVLEDLQSAREQLEAQQEAQTAAKEQAANVRADANLALTNLQAAAGQEAQFLVAVRDRINSDMAQADQLASANPELAAQLGARAAELQAKLDAIEGARAAEAMKNALAEAEARAAAAPSHAAAPPTEAPAAGEIVCPVAGDHNFTDTWGASRSGGRAHQGVDMMADFGTPTVAPVSGEVVHKSSSLGGQTWYVYGDDGNTYYGAHLSSYENQGAGWVAAGTVIGYVGSTGNAGDTNHLHFEYHPGGGSAVNPFPITSRACSGG